MCHYLKIMSILLFLFFIWWLQMAFIPIYFLYIDLFALQHIADRPGEYLHNQSLRFDHWLSQVFHKIYPMKYPNLTCVSI